ncbi:MAG: UDP-2,3-diacetamido-2,3-dideoxy-D-glucuronate 2-epimerase [Syntrophorhabdus sp. PtaB.Bin006]|nr:MAG: UDP-2,3-diacetamido-2,3-dideoxy-D-glucuronate 2-epimerase [Syntrophorhabdus sp. PtaB.Bin006]
MLIDLIAGARPNFMKIASITKAICTRQQQGSRAEYRLIHTGQHYDRAMSDSFFEQLGIPEPHVNLGAGGGTQAEQTAAIMIGYERVLQKKRSDLCLVVGDVTSTMACSIVARKMLVKVAHVEAGIRSGDWTMPEEVNRIVTDSIADYFFTTSETANENLQRNGVKAECIFFVGNTMIDTLLANMPRLRVPKFWRGLGLQPGQYFVVTLHRPANVDETNQLRTMLDAIGNCCGDLPVIFAVHPRTANTLRNLDNLSSNIKLVEPQPYLEFNYLVKHAKAVITDSGGITEEATVMGVPCMTLRDNTERPETVTMGTNELIGTDLTKLKPALDKLLSGRWKKGSIPEKWDGKTGQRIVSILEELLRDQ